MLAKEDVIFHKAATTIQQLTVDEIERANLRYREKYLASARTNDEVQHQKDQLIAKQAEQISQQSEHISLLTQRLTELEAKLNKQNS